MHYNFWNVLSGKFHVLAVKGSTLHRNQNKMLCVREEIVKAIN